MISETMLKSAGILCLSAFCILTGIQRFLCYQSYLRLLLELERFFLYMKSEIQYAKSSMPEFFRGVSGREFRCIDEWIQSILESLENNERKSRQSFSEIWKEVTRQKLDTELKNPELLHAFYRLGDEIGGMDMQSQLKYLEIFLRDLENEIENIKEQLPVRKKLYLSLGLMAGMFVAVLLV